MKPKASQNTQHKGFVHFRYLVGRVLSSSISLEDCQSITVNVLLQLRRQMNNRRRTLNKMLCDKEGDSQSGRQIIKVWGDYSWIPIMPHSEAR